MSPEQDLESGERLWVKMPITADRPFSSAERDRRRMGYLLLAVAAAQLVMTNVAVMLYVVHQRASVSTAAVTVYIAFTMAIPPALIYLAVRYLIAPALASRGPTSLPH